MGDLEDLGKKLNLASPRIIGKAKEYRQRLQIGNNSSSLAALKLSGSCTNVVCLELAASKHQQVIDKANAVRVSGMPKKMYTMALKTIESMLDLQEATSIRDLAVQIGCTPAVELATKVLKRYEEENKLQGDDLDYNTTLFQAAALCAACKKLKIRVDKGKLKDQCAVKKSSFDTLVAQMENIVEKIEGEKKIASQKRGTTLLDEIEKRIQEEVPEKRRKSEDEEEEQADDYEEWKRKILANAAKANAAKAEAASS